MAVKQTMICLFILFHGMFPVAAGVDAGGVGQSLQAGDFFGSEDGIHYLGGLDHQI